MKRSDTFLHCLISTVLLMLLVSAAEAQNQSSGQNSVANRVVVLFPSTGEQYRFRAGDSLSLRVFNHPEFSSDLLRIDERGMVSLPLIGEVVAEGLTANELRREIVLRYRKHEPHPHVYLRPLEIQFVRVYAEYDGMGREIRVSTSPMNGDEGRMIVSYVGGEEFILTFSPVKAYQTYELTAWLNGEERVNLNSAVKQNQKVYPVHGAWLELMMKVPMKSLARITDATEVKMMLGDREFQLKAKDLEAFRFMVRHVSKFPAP